MSEMIDLFNEPVLFKTRQEAGERLADRTVEMADELVDPIVLAIPRGGVPVGSSIAQKLGCAFDAISLRKLPVPRNPEAGFGAVTRDKTVVLNNPLLSQLYLSEREIDRVVDDVYGEVLRRDRVFRKDRPFPGLTGRSVLITDDGLATGYTMLAAIEFCRAHAPADIIVAVPVCHEGAYELVRPKADRVITLHVSASPVFAVASFYEQFPEMSDEEVIFYLENT